MKKIVFFLFVISAFVAVAQNNSSLETRALIQHLKTAKKGGQVSKAFLDKYPIKQNRQGATIGVMAKVDNSFNAAAVESYGIKVSSRVSDIVCMHVPLEQLEQLGRIAGITYYSVAHQVTPMMDKTRVDTRTDSVQAGLGVPMPFNGEGVLIGITDWGFDYTHPNINHKNNPRIVAAWDQFKLSGPAPAGFDYGTVYVGDSAIRAAKGDTSNLYSYGTHGTHVAGICGGNGKNGKYVGQAPGAKFLLGTWYLDEVHWLDQVAWMKSVAEAENKRLVINSSWGMYTFSTLDGTSLLSQSLNAYADSGIVFVTSAGNNGDANFHLQHTFNGSDTLRSIATYMDHALGQGLFFWGDNEGPNQFKVGFAMVNKNNLQDITYAPMYATEDNIVMLDSFIVVNNDTIHYDIMTESANPLDGRSHAVLNVERNSNYKLMMLCTADNGVHVHAWNVGNLENNAGNTGNDFANMNVYGCQDGDNKYGISEPACAEKTLTVAAHNADHYVHDSIYTPGNITFFSSFGPTLDGRQKPDVSAPGMNVVSSISSWVDFIESYSEVAWTVSAGRKYIWSTMSGTSMSSPAVSGIVALMLQANPNLNFEQIREILTSTARNDSWTGPLHANDSVSPCWGYGKVDALRAVNAAYDRLGIEEAIALQPQLVVFPNPTADRVTVRTGSNSPETMEIFSIDGRRMSRTTITAEAVVDMSTWNAGVYFIRIQDRTGVRTAKVVKN